MKINNESRGVGFVLVLFSLFILGLLLFLKLQTDGQMLAACTQACGETGDTSCSINSCPYHQNNTSSWIFIMMSILVAFIGGTGIYLSLPKKVENIIQAENIIEEKQQDLSRLSEQEKKIYLFIKELNEGAYQSTIAKEFNLSKVQCTRLMEKLEGLELVVRIRRGLTNLVSVK